LLNIFFLNLYFRRQCWLCLAHEEEVGEDLNNCWISPCRCSGTAKWVHNQCLQLWIDEKQRLDSNVVVKCSQCNTKYELVFPPNGIPFFKHFIYSKTIQKFNKILIFLGILVEIILWYESLLNKGINRLKNKY
jgi:E3 ubiquitin-protein ligase MARCH5